MIVDIIFIIYHMIPFYLPSKVIPSINCDSFVVWYDVGIYCINGISCKANNTVSVHKSYVM
jgi:hypothetical protein